MRIALFTDGIYPYVVGGIQRHSFYLCKYLAAAGIQVDLYHTNQSDYDINKLEFFTDEEKKYISSFVIPFPKHLKFPGHYIRESYEYSVRVYECFLQNSKTVDFVYSKNYTSWKYLEEKKKGKKLPPIGVNLHGYEIYQYYKGLRDNMHVFFHAKPTIYNTTEADIVFSYGKGITDLLVKNLELNKNKIVELPTGIATDWLRNKNDIIEPSRRYKKIVFVGRYAKRKGIHFIHKFIKEHLSLDFQMDFIGPIPQNFQMRSEKVKYHGQLTNKDKIQKILDDSDILLCPSYSEGMPNVILEGMARGCAILATNVGAVSEMVNNENGRLIEAGNYLKFEEALEQLINASPETITNYRKVSINRVEEKFLWKNIIIQLIDTIKKSISNG